MNDEKYLSRLIGKTLISTSMNTNTILPINGNGKELYTIGISLAFEDYQLNINNPISIVSLNKQLSDLINQKVVATVERAKEAEIIFVNGDKLVIDMRDEVYYDPEAMYLSGPNGFWVVWN